MAGKDGAGPMEAGKGVEVCVEVVWLGLKLGWSSNSEAMIFS